MERSTFANATGTARRGKDEIKWQELLQREYFVLWYRREADRQTFERYRLDMRNLEDVKPKVNSVQYRVFITLHLHKPKLAVQSSDLRIISRPAQHRVQEVVQPFDVNSVLAPPLQVRGNDNRPSTLRRRQLRARLQCHR
jgi:hypothetical protein